MMPTNSLRRSSACTVRSWRHGELGVTHNRLCATAPAADHGKLHTAQHRSYEIACASGTRNQKQHRVACHAAPLSFPGHLLASVQQANLSWEQAAVSQHLHEPGVDVHIHLVGVTPFAPLQDSFVSSVLTRLKPDVVALDLPLPHPKAGAVMLTHPKFIQVLMDHAPLCRHLSTQLGATPATHQTHTGSNAALPTATLGRPMPEHSPQSHAKDSSLWNALSTTTLQSDTSAPPSAIDGMSGTDAMRSLVADLCSPDLPAKARVGKDIFDPFEVLGESARLHT